VSPWLTCRNFLSRQAEPHDSSLPPLVQDLISLDKRHHSTMILFLQILKCLLAEAKDGEVDNDDLESLEGDANYLIPRPNAHAPYTISVEFPSLPTIQIRLPMMSRYPQRNITNTHCVLLPTNRIITVYPYQSCKFFRNFLQTKKQPTAKSPGGNSQRIF